MRLIKTFILRLYTGLEPEEQIRGNLQVRPGRKAFSFENNMELLNLIFQLANEEVKDSPARAAKKDENELNSSGSKRTKK